MMDQRLIDIFINYQQLLTKIPLLFSIMLGLYTITLLLYLAPKQIFPIPIQIEHPGFINSTTLSFIINFSELDTGLLHSTKSDDYVLIRKTWGEVFKYTFLGYDQTVQYGIIKSLLI